MLDQITRYLITLQPTLTLVLLEFIRDNWDPESWLNEPCDRRVKWVYLCRCAVQLPVQVVVCRSDQQAAGGLVSVCEGGGQAHRRLLQSATLQLLPTAGTHLRNREAEDHLLTVGQVDDALLHLLHSCSVTLSKSSSSSCLSSLLSSSFPGLPSSSLSEGVTDPGSGLSAGHAGGHVTFSTWS